jgi:uncharacterized protein DUF3617
MNRALIGVPALALAGACIGGVAQALPAAPPRAPTTAAQSAPLLPARAHHRYQHAADPAPAAADSGGVKPGQWEFTTRLDASAAQPPPGSQSPPAQSPPATPLQSGGEATYLSCIQSDRPVPFQFDGAQCKLDSRERQGPRIAWSMTCTNPQGAVRSDGTAQYRGDTMDGTLINHFPAGNGTVTDLTQRITGRYIGACPQVAQGEPPPPRPSAPPKAAANAASGGSTQWVEPPAAAGGAKPPATSGGTTPSAAAPGDAKPPAASRQEAATAPPAEARPPPRTRYAQHRRHYSRRYYGYSGGAWPGGGGLFGIRIPFLGSL